jgi:predicted KAP-like P-loop ATPase
MNGDERIEWAKRVLDAHALVTEHESEEDRRLRRESEEEYFERDGVVYRTVVPHEVAAALLEYERLLELLLLAEDE